MLWKGPNGPEAILTCIIHNYKSYWTTLEPLRYSRGAHVSQFGLKQSLTGKINMRTL